MSDGVESELRQELVRAYRELAEAGLLQLSAGNLSARLGDGVLITPTGAGADLRADDLVVIDDAGEARGAGIPSSEWSMHAAIYRARPDAAVIVHTHADACTALACLRRPLPAFHYMVAVFGGENVPCAPFADFGSVALAELTGAALAERNACLLANHGMTVHGRSVAHAVKLALQLEILARQYLLALSVSEPVLLGPGEMAEAQRRFGYYGHARIPDRG